MDTIRVRENNTSYEIEICDCYDWKRQLVYYEAFVVNKKEFIRRSVGTSKSKKAIINKAFDCISNLKNNKS